MWIYLLFIVINKYNGYQGIHSNNDKKLLRVMPTATKSPEKT